MLFLILSESEKNDEFAKASRVITRRNASILLRKKYLYRSSKYPIVGHKRFATGTVGSGKESSEDVP